MARGERAGVEAAAPSRGRRRELRRLAPPRAPGASGFAAALRPVPLREACAFVPFEAFAAARAGAAEVCGSGEARARRRREGRARRQRVRSRVTTRRAEARRGGPRLGGARERSRVRVDRKKRRARREGVRREDPEPHGSRRTVPRAGTAPSPGMALVSRVSPVRCLVSPPGEKPRAPLLARAAREMDPRTRARPNIYLVQRTGKTHAPAAAEPRAPRIDINWPFGTKSLRFVIHAESRMRGRFRRISRRLLFRRSCHIIFTFHIFMTECELVPPKDREKNHAQARRLESSASQCPSIFARVPVGASRDSPQFFAVQLCAFWRVCERTRTRWRASSSHFTTERRTSLATPTLSRTAQKVRRAPSTRGSARRTRRTASFPAPRA